MKTEIQNGLSKSTHDSATVKMLPTFVQSTPDGTGDTHTLYKNTQAASFAHLFFVASSSSNTSGQINRFMHIVLYVQWSNVQVM